MSLFKAKTDDYVERISDSFAKQGMMQTLGARLNTVEPGFVEIEISYDQNLTQQHGFIHAGALTAIVDSAGGLAALSLFEAGDGVLTVEFKINLMAPADGEKIIARGQVVRPGRTITVTTGEVISVKNGIETTCAIMQQTMMRIIGREGVMG